MEQSNFCAPRQMIGCGLCVLTICFCAPVHAAITIDGKLDEPEWAQARQFGEFKVTEPYRLTDPDPGTKTQARLMSTPDGIVVGFTLEQAPDIARIKPRLERDQDDPADAVNFMIDFDGDGRTAYSFTVGLSGSIIDGVVNNENEESDDWDTDWSWAVSENGDHWYVEMLIPWTVAPMQGTDTPSRTVAVYFSRLLGKKDERLAFPALTTARGRFVSGFERVEIPQYRKALLHFWPYATARYDLIDRRVDYKVGADLFWKPSPDFQLSATVNPDFGQVESDDLVVNFDAIETFVGEKRPFFTENQSIFDLRTPDSGRLVHTRRIGGEADDGSSASDIDLAVKFNGSLGKMGYGVMAATEDGDAGRDFFAARLQYPFGPRFNLGWLGTDVERPYIDRSAQVHAVDMSWKPNEKLIIGGQVLGSFIEEAGKSSDDTGAWLRVDWSPTDSWNYELEATHFGSDLDFNDLGFQRRASLNELEVTGTYVHRSSKPEAWLRSSRWSVEGQARSNDHGDRMPNWLILGSILNFRNGNTLYMFGSLIGSGVDDLISRGNGLLHKSSRYDFVAEFASARYGDWSFDAQAQFTPIGLSSTTARELSLSANWYPSDAFNAAFEFGPEWTSDWLIWEDGRDFGRYSRRYDFASLKLSWFPGLRHEFRLKTEWLAIRASDGQRYILQPDGGMLATDVVLDDFSINNFGMQLRYRYLLGPQSDVFLAYSRGGFLRQDRSDMGTGELFDEALGLRDSDQFLAKIRYRF